MFLALNIETSKKNSFPLFSPTPHSFLITIVEPLSPCVSMCRTRLSSTSRRQARLRPRTSSRRRPNRRLPSRALPKQTAPPEPRGPLPAGVYNTVRTRGRPTRNLESGPLGPPQAPGCCSQSTRSVGSHVASSVCH